MADEIVLAGASRTAIGGIGGQLAEVPATALGAAVVRAAVARSHAEPHAIGEVYLGNVLSAGLGQNPARQAAIAAGVPDSVAAVTVGKVCGSGLQAVILATRAVRCGDADLVVA